MITLRSSVSRSSGASRRLILALLLAGLGLSLLLLGCTASPAPASPPPTTEIVAGIISQVNTRMLEYELAGLTGERQVVVAGSLYTITTRNSEQGEAISMTTRYAYERFASFGLAVTYHDYVWNVHDTGDADRVPSRSRSYREGRNVVAEKPGLVDPGRVYLVTAHIDDLPEGPRAPGADDNGSGAVAVLTAARLLAPYDFAYTIRFVLFTGEEQGLHGSGAYAADCLARREDIRGVINLDMIAYNSDAEPVVDLYASGRVTTSLELTRVFSEVIGVYGLDLVPNRFDVSDGFPIEKGDQWSFLLLGYPAMLVIEDWDDHTPYMHMTGDRISTLDLDYYVETTRAVIATIAHLAVPVYEPEQALR